MKAREAQMIGDANLRNFALISSIPVALLTFRLLSCVSMKLKVSFHSMTSDPRVGGRARGQNLVHLQKLGFLC